MLIFWVVMPCGVIGKYHNFREECCPYSPLKMERVCPLHQHKNVITQKWWQIFKKFLDYSAPNFLLNNLL
jgi:hypothetical protein